MVASYNSLILGVSMRRLAYVLVFIIAASHTEATAISPPAEILKEMRAEQRDDADLQAQQDMALWAWWMLVVSAASSGIGAAGLFFLWQSLKQTREAITLNTRSQEHAEEQARLEMRPWLEIHDIRLDEIITVNDDNQFSAKGTFTIRNIGKLPALNVNHAQAISSHTDHSIRQLVRDLVAASPAGHFDIPPGGEVHARLLANGDATGGDAKFDFALLRMGLSYRDRYDREEYSSYAFGYIHKNGEDLKRADLRGEYTDNLEIANFRYISVD